MATTACASLTSSQSRRLAELQAFADRTTTTYGVAAVHVTASALPDGWAARYWPWRRRIEIAPFVLTWPARYGDKVVAHELGHALLGHSDTSAANEAAADAEAVRILERAHGMSEAAAFQMVFDYFCWLDRSPPAAWPPGHVSPRQKMSDLKMRYPAEAWVTCPGTRR